MSSQDQLPLEVPLQRASLYTKSGMITRVIRGVCEGYAYVAFDYERMGGGEMAGDPQTVVESGFAARAGNKSIPGLGTAVGAGR